jgi:hypothetical protein
MTVPTQPNRALAEHVRVNWRRLGIALVTAIALLVNLALVYRTIAYWHGPAWGQADDWNELVQAATSRDPYLAHGFRWSPVAASLLAILLPMGIGAWRALHFAALLILRDLRLVALVLVSWPFWDDMVSGNVLTFAAIAGWAAVRGSRLGGVAFLAMGIMMPRPLFLPLAVWLLWKEPWTRGAAAVLIGIHLGLVVISGFGPEWIDRLVATGGAEIAHPQNLAPTHWIGLIWIPFGAALAGWLVWRGHLGLASLAASPYLFGYYLLFAVLEFRSATPSTIGHRWKPHGFGA